MNKKGSSIVAAPIILAISLFMIIIIGNYIISSIIPFIYHEKLNSIAGKYMFVIEKFGYLKEEEKNSMLNELGESGFDKDKVSITYPNIKKEYGEIIELKLTYRLITFVPKFKNGLIYQAEKETILTVRKNSFSKI